MFYWSKELLRKFQMLLVSHIKVLSVPYVASGPDFAHACSTAKEKIIQTWSATFRSAKDIATFGFIFSFGSCLIKKFLRAAIPKQSEPTFRDSRSVLPFREPGSERSDPDDDVEIVRLDFLEGRLLMTSSSSSSSLEAFRFC